MEINSHLKKQFIKRRIVGDTIPKPPTDPEGYYAYPDNNPFDNRFQYLTQEDLKREIEPSAHDINSKYQSTRPIKELQERKIKTVDENGKEVVKTVQEWVITGYDELETTRFGLQKRCSTVKTSHMSADGFWIAQEGTDSSEEAHKNFDCLNSWKDTAGLDTMWLEIVSSCNETTDALAYLYATKDGRIKYKVYSYDDDYIIFPDTDENRNPVYYVLYNIKGKKAVDIFSVDGVSTWIADAATLERNARERDMKKWEELVDKSWWQKVRNWFKTDRREVSEDGWVKVSSSESQVPEGMGQAFYFRIPDIPSGIVQMDIERRAERVIRVGGREVGYVRHAVCQGDKHRIAPARRLARLGDGCKG